MNELVIAVVGDTNPQRTFQPPMKEPAQAKKAAEELGAELAKRGGIEPELEGDEKTNRIHL